jgi:hypothetical protein
MAMPQRTVVGLIVALILGSAAPARSAGIEGLWLGVNGLLTFVADPVVETIFPPEDFEDFPGNEVFRYPFGFLSGTILGTYRAISGVLDVALTPLWIVPSLSPEPRYDVIPFYDFEEETR